MVVTYLGVRNGCQSWLARTGPKFEKAKANKNRYIKDKGSQIGALLTYSCQRPILLDVCL